MKAIAHRGNLTGPEPAVENSLDHIQKAIDAGCIVEVDLRRLGGDLYFGHDYPQHKVPTSWIDDRHEDLLLHVKEFGALKHVQEFGKGFGWHFICHTSDPYTLTSQGLLWLHDLSLEPNGQTVVPLLSLDNLRSYPADLLKRCLSVCTDFPVEYINLLKAS